MRILIYTGKGGVGKTSIAAATALRLARTGKKVILMSTDQAHSLKDSFSINYTMNKKPKNDTDNKNDIGNKYDTDNNDTDNKNTDNKNDIDNKSEKLESLGEGPLVHGDLLKLTETLDLLEINTIEESRKAWGNLQGYLREIISQKANGGIAAKEALQFPGFEELFALLRILDVYESGLYDVAVIDCAPTGETLAMLRYPERLAVLADKILPMVRNVNKAFGSFISRKTSVPKPRDAVFAEFDQLIKRLNILRGLLQDRDITSIRIVMSPERIVIDEARRSYTWIQVYDFGVDAVYVNRIYPEKALTGYFEGWSKMQKESLSLVEESFKGQKIFLLEMQDDEIRGMDMLEKIGLTLYKDEVLEELDPSQIFCKEQAFRLEDEDGTRIFIVRLPHAKREELAVHKDGKELILTFRNETRRFRLPDKLVRRYISKWDYAEGEMKIYMDYE